VYIFYILLIVFGKTLQNILNKTTSNNSSILSTSLFIGAVPVFLCIPLLYYNNDLKFLSYNLMVLSLISGVLVGFSTIPMVKSYNIGEVSVITPFTR
jgi:RsiW-degrading membrane proteinase PrsW (M82 family)